MTRSEEYLTKAWSYLMSAMHLSNDTSDVWAGMRSAGDLIQAIWFLAAHSHLRNTGREAGPWADFDLSDFYESDKEWIDRVKRLQDMEHAGTRATQVSGSEFRAVLDWLIYKVENEEGPVGLVLAIYQYREKSDV